MHGGIRDHLLQACQWEADKGCSSRYKILDIHQWLTPTAVAIWYMDDGGKAQNTPNACQFEESTPPRGTPRPRWAMVDASEKVGANAPSLGPSKKALGGGGCPLGPMHGRRPPFEAMSAALMTPPKRGLREWIWAKESYS